MRKRTSDGDGHPPNAADAERSGTIRLSGPAAVAAFVRPTVARLRQAEMDSFWYMMDGETRRGPLSVDELLPALLSMPEPRLARGWREGMADWERAGSVREFAGKLPPRVPGPSSPAPQPRPTATETEGPPRAIGPVVTANTSVAPRSISGIVVDIAAGAIVVWAVLIVLASLASTSNGSMAGTVGLSALLTAYALGLFMRDPRALPLAWVVVVLFGLGTVLSGLVPLMILLWSCLLGFALYLRKHRDMFSRRRRVAAN